MSSSDFEIVHMSNASSMTSIPSRSCASSIAGLTGLWALRSALNPAALRISTAAPRHGERRGADHAVVVMDGRAAQVDPLAVDAQAAFDIERQRADAEMRRRVVDGIAAPIDEGRAARVDVWLIDAPPLRPRDGHVAALVQTCPARPSGRPYRRAHQTRRRVRRRPRCGLLGRVVHHGRLDDDDRSIVVDVQGRDAQAVEREVDRVGNDEPHVAVDPGTQYQRESSLARDHPDLVVFTHLQVRHEVDAELGVPVRSVRRELAVHEDGAVPVHAVELQHDALCRAAARAPVLRYS